MILLDMLLEGKIKKAHDGVSILYEKDDFSRLELPQYWWYYLNELREGIAVDFPIKLKTVLTYLKHRHAMHARVTFSGGWINRNSRIGILWSIVCVVRITVTKNKLYWCHGYLLVQNADCRLQNAECRPDTKCRLQTAEWVQNAD